MVSRKRCNGFAGSGSQAFRFAGGICEITRPHASFADLIAEKILSGIDLNQTGADWNRVARACHAHATFASFDLDRGVRSGKPRTP
jgi:hypothetical protein